MHIFILNYHFGPSDGKKKEVIFTLQNKNSEKRSAARRVLSALDLPAGVLSRDVHIEMRGRSELYIDGCRSVVLYEDGVITLDAGSCKITVEGSSLVLCSLAGDQLRIEGNIRSVSFE